MANFVPTEHANTLPNIIVVCGPTATGKSDLAVDIALHLKEKGVEAEIISTDSRQIYRGLDIGSGKITKEEMLHRLLQARKHMWT